MEPQGFIAYSLEPSLRPFTCHINPVRILADYLFNTYFNVLVPFTHLSASDILTSVSLTPLLREMLHRALILHGTSSCVKIHIITQGKILTNIISVRQFQTRYSNVYADEGPEHVDCKAAGLLLRSLDGATNVIFDIIPTGIIN
jgi:hypothetical protein